MSDNDIPSIVVGWEEWLALPDLALPAIKAKVDTGAKTSSLHAFMVEPYSTGVKDRVRFGIHPLPDRPDIEVYCSADLIDRREITSSNGEAELRYIISTTLKVADEEWPIEISLTNREGMNYRMLLGRTAIRGRAVVDPESSCVHGELSADLYDEITRDAAHSNNLKIGILSREPNNYTTRRLVEAAESRGHLVEVVNTTRCSMTMTSRKPKIFIGDKPLIGFDAIIPRIGASVTFYGMALVRQFEMMGIYTLNGSQGIGASRDKLYAHQLLARAGVDMPVTAMAHSPDDIKHMIKAVGNAPLIVKLLEGTQGRGVVLAETQKAAESVIGAFRGLKANLLVQEFIKESGGSDIRCLVIGNKVVGSMMRTAADGDFRSNLHRGGAAKGIRITAQERATAVKATRILGLKLAGVDMLRSKDGPKVLEVNSSPGLEGIERATGGDIAGAIMEYLQKYAREKRKRPARKKKT